MSKIFFDTNILLDILLPIRANHKKAVSVYKIVCDEYDILSTSENILTTIEYIASKNKTDCKDIWQFFKNLTESFEIYSFKNILNDSLNIYYRACLEKNKIDFEDLLQLQCAIKNNSTAFITEDKQIHKIKIDMEILCLDNFFI